MQLAIQFGLAHRNCRHLYRWNCLSLQWTLPIFGRKCKFQLTYTMLFMVFFIGQPSFPENRLLAAILHFFFKKKNINQVRWATQRPPCKHLKTILTCSMRWVEKFKWIMRWYAFHFVTTTIQLYIVLFDCPLMITIFYLLFKAESIVNECGNTHCMIFVSCE